MPTSPRARARKAKAQAVESDAPQTPSAPLDSKTYEEAATTPRLMDLKLEGSKMSVTMGGTLSPVQYNTVSLALTIQDVEVPEGWTLEMAAKRLVFLASHAWLESISTAFAAHEASLLQGEEKFADRKKRA